MSITPLSFSGISNFSQDFQVILDRAVSIAALPVQQMQADQADLLAKKTALSGLRSSLADLASRITELGSLGTSKALAGFSSNREKVAIGSVSASQPAAYTITNISSIAEAASEITTGYADADTAKVHDDQHYRLVYGTGPNEYVDFSLSAAENNLVGLRNNINSLPAGVNASILAASGPAPAHLSVARSATGASKLQLLHAPTLEELSTAGPETNLLSSTNQGADAVFELNGMEVRRSGNVIVDAVPGLTFTVLDTTEPGTSELDPEQVRLTLSSDRTRVAQALEGLATSYNAVLAGIDAQVGENAGLLSGDSLVRQARQAITAITTYFTSGTVRSIADLGISLSDTGEMSFDREVLDDLSESAFQASFSFLGSTRSGFGALAGRLTLLSDPIDGLIKLQQDEYDETDARLQADIDALSEQIGAMQESLRQKLTAADVLLASLESQQSVLTASVESLNYTLYGRKDQ
jgi:flagellar hook-associated protein 2